MFFSGAKECLSFLFLDFLSRDTVECALNLLVVDWSEQTEALRGGNPEKYKKKFVYSYLQFC